MPKHEVTLTFVLDEEVTPGIFAEKIALACAYRGAIRVGERVAGGNRIYEYVGLRKVDLFGKGDPITVPGIEQINGPFEDGDYDAAA